MLTPWERIESHSEAIGELIWMWKKEEFLAWATRFDRWLGESRLRLVLTAVALLVAARLIQLAVRAIDARWPGLHRFLTRPLWRRRKPSGDGLVEGDTPSP